MLIWARLRRIWFQMVYLLKLNMCVYLRNFTPNPQPPSSQPRLALKLFDDMIADRKANKKLKAIVSALFMRERKLNNSVLFISQSYLQKPPTIRTNATHYFIMKMPNKKELQQVALNQWSDIEFKDLMKL